MTFKDARKQCRKVGTAYASGDALRSMYAELIAMRFYAIGNAPKHYDHLQSFPTDKEITDEARRLLRDSNAALDVVLA